MYVVLCAMVALLLLVDCNNARPSLHLQCECECERVGSHALTRRRSRKPQPWHLSARALCTTPVAFPSRRRLGCVRACCGNGTYWRWPLMTLIHCALCTDARHEARHGYVRCPWMLLVPTRLKRLVIVALQCVYVCACACVREQVGRLPFSMLSWLPCRMPTPGAWLACCALVRLALCVLSVCYPSRVAVGVQCCCEVFMLDHCCSSSQPRTPCRALPPGRMTSSRSTVARPWR